MTDLITTVAGQLSSWSIAELAAVIFAILYLVLAIQENILCWICAGFSTAIYVAVFFDARLYMESLLNLFYFGMAIYGWIVWSVGRQGVSARPVVRWPLSIHSSMLVVLAAGALISGWLLERFTDAAFPYVDSATTFASAWATFLVARKVLENWWYWLVIDVVSVWIFWNRGLELTALLFAFYVLLIPFGLVRWTRSWREGQAQAMA